ncbi:MAG TPA: EscU/YscU/HrcU family type III secretion system export apparatus switch protein [Solirubrobacteraceae bacterium]|jgi:flagellar biosynthesis protein|nr:EscU/YscU/HrcU family type III secretion system export apparatus switch protein [Solirubrobacteraceae bacterium]
MSTEREPPEEPRRATALSYELGDTAPQVVATGRGHVAEQIIAAAQAAGVPVRSDPALTKALDALELGSEIPEALYRAVAETLAWAYGLDLEAAKATRLR